MRWDEFAAECPELADLIHERFEREQIFLLGTLRPDGSPRISGLECDFVDGELMSSMIWQSAKARDLLRDSRMTIHSLVPDKEHESENQGDLKLYGHARAINEPEHTALRGDHRGTYRLAAARAVSLLRVRSRPGGRGAIRRR